MNQIKTPKVKRAILPSSQRTSIICCGSSFASSCSNTLAVKENGMSTNAAASLDASVCVSVFQGDRQNSLPSPPVQLTFLLLTKKRPILSCNSRFLCPGLCQGGVNNPRHLGHGRSVDAEWTQGGREDGTGGRLRHRVLKK